MYALTAHLFLQHYGVSTLKQLLASNLEHEYFQLSRLSDQAVHISTFLRDPTHTLGDTLTVRRSELIELDRRLASIHPRYDVWLNGPTGARVLSSLVLGAFQLDPTLVNTFHFFQVSHRLLFHRGFELVPPDRLPGCNSLTLRDFLGQEELAAFNSLDYPWLKVEDAINPHAFWFITQAPQYSTITRYHLSQALPHLLLSVANEETDQWRSFVRASTGWLPPACIAKRFFEHTPAPFPELEFISPEQIDAARQRSILWAYQELRSNDWVTIAQHDPAEVKAIGDISCLYNARSSYLRCAVNPNGPCEGCKHYEKSDV